MLISTPTESEMFNTPISELLKMENLESSTVDEDSQSSPFIWKVFAYVSSLYIFFSFVIPLIVADVLVEKNEPVHGLLILGIWLTSVFVLRYISALEKESKLFFNVSIRLMTPFFIFIPGLLVLSSLVPGPFENTLVSFIITLLTVIMCLGGILFLLLYGWNPEEFE